MQKKHLQSSQVETPSHVYIETFRCRCFELIHEGYRQLDVLSLHNEEEPGVTGELVASITKVINNQDSPEWVDHFVVKDNTPLNVAGKKGKSRPIVDMEFELTSRRPRSLYRIESKWVGKGKPSLGAEKGYLGKEGIGCFLSEKYPVDDRQAGMLAYVYSDNEIFWSEKIQRQLESKACKLKIIKTNGRVWIKDKIQEPFHAYVSIHNSPDQIGQLHITHLLLNFLSN